MSEDCVKGLSDSAVAIDKLPTLPAIAMEAIRLMDGAYTSLDAIGELLRRDQVLASRILHYANAPAVGIRRKTASIAEALSLLGLNAVRSIILSVSIFDCFSGPLASRKAGLVDFWLHAIGVAQTARELAVRLGFPAPEEAYTAGLLHDLGKLVAFLQGPEDFERLCQAVADQGARSQNGPLPLSLEKTILGTDHTEIGRLLAGHWRLPEHLGRVLWLHHQPVFEPIRPKPDELPALVRFADVLCVTHGIGSSYFLAPNGHGHEHFHFALENLLYHHGLDGAQVQELMDGVTEKVGALGQVLGFSSEEIYRKLLADANRSLGSMSLDLDRNNQDLQEANRVLAAVAELNRRLAPELSAEAAAREILSLACDTFRVGRGVCLVRQPAEPAYAGQFHEGEGWQTFTVPAAPEEMDQARSAGPAIQKEAVARLAATASQMAAGGLEASIMAVVTQARFLATFFVAESGRGGELLGELLLDFTEGPGLAASQGRLASHFEAFALAASRGVERLHLTAELARQGQEMAETSRRMEESHRQLFHSHRLATVGRLAAGAAHEINNPLTIISLNIQIMQRLLRGQTGVTAASERLAVVSDQVERIAKIVQDLMSFARPNEPKRLPTLSGAVLGKVLSVLGDRVAMHRITVKNHLPGSLPLVLVDPLQIEQVFMNLLINASQAMPEGGSITITGQERDQFVTIEITDTGVGIPKENLSKIFDPFFTTKREGEGTGLGLAICHTIVEHNGGFLRVQSEVGRGTTFTLGLPLEQGSRLRALPRASEAHPAEPVSAGPPARHRVLVVDDEPVLNQMVREALTVAGYEAEGAHDGLAAIERLREKAYSVVLLDIRMPGKDGLAVLRYIKDEHPKVPAIVISAVASKEEIQETIRMGAFAYLKKPFLLDKVLEVIQRALTGERPEISAKVRTLRSA
ncbi:MAG: HDOD domain-containing protein [Thermodesulfobacteriota bacterium]